MTDDRHTASGWVPGLRQVLPRALYGRPHAWGTVSANPASRPWAPAAHRADAGHWPLARSTVARIQGCRLRTKPSIDGTTLLGRQDCHAPPAKPRRRLRSGAPGGARPADCL